MNDQLTRRRLFALGGLATLGVALSACGSDSASGGKSGDLGRLTYAFSWLNDVTQAGPYVSDTKGYYTKAGFSSVKFISGGPSAVSVLTQMANGTAQFGVASPTEVVAANEKGASFRVIGAMYQKTPACIVSLPGKPLATPGDLKGKTIGVPDSDKPAMLAFLAVNGLGADDLKIVPFQYDPAPLINGQVDGFLGYSTSAGVTLKEAGHEAVLLNFGDFRYATVTQTYVATTDQISSSRNLIKAALRADIMGWRDTLTDPGEGANLTVTKYGKSLGYTLQNQLECLKAELVLMKTPDTEKNGLLTVTPALQAETVKTLGLTGVKTSVDDLFDLSVLDEVYQEHPELKALA